LRANPAVRAEFEVSAELIRARLRAGLTQAEVAAHMGASPAVIARLESGQTLPSTKTLLRFAQATKSRLQINLPAA
jgi:transcriptional regulator with XRE-family HTH domain